MTTHELFNASEGGDRAELIHSLAASPEVPFAASELARFPTTTLRAFTKQFGTPETPPVLLTKKDQRSMATNTRGGIPTPPPVLLAKRGG